MRFDRLVPSFSLRTLFLGAAAMLADSAIAVLRITWWVPMQERAKAVDRLRSGQVRVEQGGLFAKSHSARKNATPKAGPYLAQLLADDKNHQAIRGAFDFTSAPDFATDDDCRAIAALIGLEELDLTKMEKTLLNNGNGGFAAETSELRRLAIKGFHA